MNVEREALVEAAATAGGARRPRTDAPSCRYVSVTAVPDAAKCRDRCSIMSA